MSGHELVGRSGGFKLSDGEASPIRSRRLTAPNGIIIGSRISSHLSDLPLDAIPATVPSRSRRASVNAKLDGSSHGALSTLGYLGRRLFNRSTSAVAERTEHLKKRLEKSAKLEPKLNMENTPFRITFVGGNKTITRGTAIMMILNQLLAGGIEEIPFGYLLLGWVPMLLMNMGLMCLAMIASLMIARVMTMIPGNQLYTQRFEYVAIVRHFLGAGASRLVELCFHFLICHSLLSFNDAVAALETFIVRPLTGSVVSLEWNPYRPHHLPRIASIPVSSPNEGLSDRLKTPPWFTALRLKSAQTLLDDTATASAGTASSSLPLSYIVLASLVTIVAGRNLDDDPWFQHVAFIFSASMWLIIMTVCIARAPFWNVWITKGLTLMAQQGGGYGYPHSSSWRSIYGFRSPYSPIQILRNFMHRKVARLYLGLLQTRDIWLRGLNKFRFSRSKAAKVLPIIALTSSGHLTSNGGSPQMMKLVRNLRILRSVPGVTIDQLNHQLLSRDILLDEWPISNTIGLPQHQATCGACYDDLCFDLLDTDNLLICPAALEQISEWREYTTRRYIESQYKSERDKQPRIPPFFNKKWRNTFTLLAAFVRIWSVTDMVPSLVNELRTDVDVTQTFWTAFWIGGVSIFVTTFTVAAAFPGLASFAGVSPMTLTTDSTLPQILSNTLLFSYAICTIIPSKLNTHPHTHNGKGGIKGNLLTAAEVSMALAEGSKLMMIGK